MDQASSATPTTREQRLAAQLRANLRRRKDQARALDRATRDRSAVEAGGEPANPALVNPAPDG